LHHVSKPIMVVHRSRALNQAQQLKRTVAGGLLLLGVIIFSHLGRYNPMLKQLLGQKVPNITVRLGLSSSHAFVPEESESYYAMPPLKPGKPGRCLFHSQHKRGFQQDRRLFVALGGKVEEASCTRRPLSGVRFSSSGLACDCTAPADPRAFGASNTFLDIGANDGQYLSNTLFFEAQMGWRGLCVEGAPISFKILAKMRPNCVNVNGVVGAGISEATFFTFDSPGSWESGLSCMEGSKHHITGACLNIGRAYRYAKEKKLSLYVDKVPGYLLRDLFRQHGFAECRMMTIDVEGAEDIVMSTSALSVMRPTPPLPLQFAVLSGSAPAQRWFLSVMPLKEVPMGGRRAGGAGRRHMPRLISRLG
jgi:FkbM family methyltransferase